MGFKLQRSSSRRLLIGIFGGRNPLFKWENGHGFLKRGEWGTHSARKGITISRVEYTSLGEEVIKRKYSGKIILDGEESRAI